MGFDTKRNTCKCVTSFMETVANPGKMKKKNEFANFVIEI
jgi:hypothetical protein